MVVVGPTKSCSPGELSIVRTSWSPLEGFEGGAGGCKRLFEGYFGVGNGSRWYGRSFYQPARGGVVPFFGSPLSPFTHQETPPVDWSLSARCLALEVPIEGPRRPIRTMSSCQSCPLSLPFCLCPDKKAWQASSSPNPKAVSFFFVCRDSLFRLSHPPCRGGPFPSLLMTPDHRRPPCCCWITGACDQR